MFCGILGVDERKILNNALFKAETEAATGAGVIMVRAGLIMFGAVDKVSSAAPS